jgi:hypothetical protein
MVDDQTSQDGFLASLASLSRLVTTAATSAIGEGLS